MKKQNKIYKYIMMFKLKNIWLIFWILAWAVSSVISSLLLTFILNAIIDKNWNYFLLLSILDIFCWIIVSYTQAVKDTVKETLMQEELNAIRADILIPITENDYATFSKNSKSEYISWLINDMNLLRDNGLSQFYGAIESIITVSLNAFAIIFINWMLLLVAIVMTVFVYYSPKIFESRVAKATEKVSDYSNRVLRKTNDFVNGFEVFYHNNQSVYFKNEILSSFKSLIFPKVKLVQVSTIANSVSMTASIIAQTIMFIATGYLIIKGKVTTGVIFSIANLTSYLFNYTRGAAYNIVTFSATSKLMDKYPFMVNKEEKINKSSFDEKLVLSNVRVKFDNKEIEYPNLEIKKGMKVAIIGESGSGKSTLLKLLAGEIVDYNGNIFIDDINYRDINFRSLQKIIGIMHQKPYIFSETLRDNLLIGRDIKEEIFNKAIKLSNVDEFIQTRLEDVYADDLSGGQKQRISMARELMGEKEILILDESTSNLDRKKAIEVEQNILEQKDITVIMVTHHLYDENKKYFDNIVELK